MTLGNFQPRQRISGDKMQFGQYIGRPLLVRTNEYVPDFSSQAYPTPKPVVFCDVVDLLSGQIFINVLWGGGAVVDNLKETAGTEVVLPVMPGHATAKGGRTYQTLNALEGDAAALAQGWYQRFWGNVDAERTKREQASKPFQNQPAAAPAPQQGFQPPAQQPAQQYQQAPATQPPPNPAYGQQAPATQQYAPAPAQQYQQPVQYADPNAGQQYQQAPAQQQQYAAPAGQLPHDQYQPAPQQYADPNAGQQFAAPAAQPQQAYSPPPAQPQAQPGMFTDGPPPGDPAAMLAQLNNQLS